MKMRSLQKLGFNQFSFNNYLNNIKGIATKHPMFSQSALTSPANEASLEPAEDKQTYVSEKGIQLPESKKLWYTMFSYQQLAAVIFRNCQRPPIGAASNEDIFQESLKHPDYFGVSKLFNVEDLFKANVHLGHKEGSLCNYMRPYVFGSRLGHLIIDLDKTSEMMRDALNFTAHIAFRDGIILFLCRGIQHQLLVEKTAEDCKEFSHTRIWVPGTITDSAKFFGCTTRLPDLIIFLNTMNDVLQQHTAVIESAKMLIPSVGIVDTNCDPRLLTYPVPGNDDTHFSIKLYCKLFKEAVLLGKQKRKELITSV